MTKTNQQPLVERLQPALKLLDGLETGQRCEEYAFAEADGFEAMTYIPDAFEALRSLPEAIATITRLTAERDALIAERDTPAVAEFAKAVQLEAGHQRGRWGAEHDDGKTPFDWFWLIGYLAQKAASAAVAGDNEKALHHTISTAAALANWHLALSGGDNSMRPGIEPPTILAGASA